MRPSYFSWLSAFALAVSSGSAAMAQHHHHHHHYAPRYQVQHHDHIVRDSHGHIIGRYHHDVVPQSAQFILPHIDQHRHGSYYVQNGTSYYYPQTISNNAQYYTTARPVAVTFGGFAHVEDLASRLESETNDLCYDMHYNYSHNPGYDQTYREAYHLYRVAEFIHAAEHISDRDAIRGKLAGMDKLFHHIRDDIRDWSRHHHRQVGPYGFNTRLDVIESVLHHLMTDVGVRPDVPQGQPGVGPTGGPPAPAGGPNVGPTTPTSGVPFNPNAVPGVPNNFQPSAAPGTFAPQSSPANVQPPTAPFNPPVTPPQNAPAPPVAPPQAPAVSPAPATNGEFLPLPSLKT